MGAKNPYSYSDLSDSLSMESDAASWNDLASQVSATLAHVSEPYKEKAHTSCPTGFPPSLEQLHLRWYDQIELTAYTRRMPSKHRRNLSDCVNLAPAGAATQSLYEQLLLAAPENRFWHHSHAFRIGGRGHRNISCYILTLRDPADRLVSGYRWDVAANGPHELQNLFRLPNASALPTVSDFVAAFRNRSSAAYASVMRNYWSSVAWPTADRFGLNLGFTGGNNFLVSQLDYLRGYMPSWMELHVVCTERFSEDVSALLSRFGVDGDGDGDGDGQDGQRTILHQHHRSNQTIGGHDRQTLSLGARRFVRECLYPHDTQLHQLLCGA